MSKWDFAVAAWVPISTENILCARGTEVKPSRLKGAKSITWYAFLTKNWMVLKNGRRRAIQCCCEENVIWSFCWNWDVTKRSRKERSPEFLNAAAKYLQVASFNNSKRRVIPMERIIENLNFCIWVLRGVSGHHRASDSVQADRCTTMIPSVFSIDSSQQRRSTAASL
jgi:hypothetical protein